MLKKIRKSLSSNAGAVAAVMGFLAAWGFFQLVYPYHLIRREQMTLFLFDWDYIRQTYQGAGWLARFACDFLDQFFLVPAVGPIAAALLLVAIGAVTYRIFRKFTGRWPALAAAAAMFVWTFFRETDNYYSTRYTLAALGYLSLLLAALSFRNAWMRPVAAAVLLAFGAWTLGQPFNSNYGRAWGTPVPAYDKIIGLDTEISRGNWDKVIQRSKNDLYMTEATFCYNLANAMKGQLGENLFNYTQNSVYGLLIWIIPEHSTFSNGLAGEAWFRLGELTGAEQAAIISLQGSPKHTGARYIKRLAEINLISGEYGAAQKYLNLLDKTLFYHRWARQMMPGRQDSTLEAELNEARGKLSEKDFVYSDNGAFVAVLNGLLEADPANDMAREYLLCYYMLAFDLDSFAGLYARKPLPHRSYQEAILVWLSQNDAMTEDNFARYGISENTLNRMERFFMRPERFRNTYWFYYMDAATRQQ